MSREHRDSKRTSPSTKSPRQANQPPYIKQWTTGHTQKERESATLHSITDVTSRNDNGQGSDLKSKNFSNYCRKQIDIMNEEIKEA